MGSNQPLGEKLQYSQSGYIIFYELDSLFLHVTREKQASRGKTSALTGRCLFKPRAASQFIGHAGERLKSHAEAARPTGAHSQARAACTERGRAGAELGRAPQRAPPGRRPRTAGASPAPGQEAWRGTTSPRMAGRDHSPPARLPEGRFGPPRPHPASVFPAPARPHPAIPARRGHDCQPGLAPGKAPPPSAPIGGPAP